MKQTCVKFKRLTVTLVLCLAIVSFACAGIIGAFSALAEGATASTRNWTESVTVSNYGFSESTSGTPASPSSWTGEALQTGKTAIGGVVDVNAYKSYSAETKKEYKFADGVTLSTPKKGADYQDSDNSVLFINSTSDTAYGFSSSDLTFEKSAFYEIKVYVRTVVTQGGASVTVSGLKDDAVGIVGINTHGEWKTYSLYVATPSLTASTVKIKLGLGDGKTSASGAAFFDHVTVTRLSANGYYDKANVATEPDENGLANVAGGTKTTAKVDLTEKADALAFVGGGTVDVTNGGVVSGFENPVYSAFDGKSDDLKAYRLSTDYDESKDEFKSGYATLSTSEFSLARHGYYLVGGWYYSERFDDGTPKVKISYKSANSATAEGEYDESEEFSLTVPTSSSDRNGWQKYDVLIKCSDRYDVKASLSITAGVETSKAKGAILLDVPSVMQITPATYDNLSSAVTGSVTVDSEITTGITNGNFDLVGKYESLDDLTSGKPLLPANWTLNATEDEGLESGLVDFTNAGAGKTSKTIGNVLTLKGDNVSAVYASDTFTVAANGYSLVTVDVVAQNVIGYGATVTLKRDGGTIASIEKITETGRYNFYVKGAASAVTLTAELGFGKGEKTASGTVYFTRVGLLTAAGNVTANGLPGFNFAATEDEFSEKSTAYETIRLTANVKNVAISLGNEDMSLFDNYSTADLKAPYNWSLSTTDSANVFYGIVDSKHRGDALKLPVSFKPYGDSYPYALAIVNGARAQSTVTLDNAYTLAADSYYKLTLAVKTYNIDPETAVGAFVALGDDKFTFTSTAKPIDGIEGDVTTLDPAYVDYENYDLYSFYIKTGSEESKSNLTVGIGGSKNAHHASGTLVVGYVNLESIESVDYEEATVDLAEDEKFIDSYNMRVDLSAATDEDETEEVAQSGEVAWWLVPSILLAVAVVIAVVGTFIRKKIENRPQKPHNPSTRSSYDRRNLTLPENDEVTEPTETTEATGTEATEATEATEPTETTEATEATEPTEATGTTEATEATEVTEATGTTESTEATETVATDETKENE